MSEKKRYWLKLDKNFLKNPQIKVIKGMPNGKDYVLFYLALMLESIETVGHLRFSDLIPYNDEMLAVITDTNVDIVRTAIKIFQQFGLIQVLNDQTIYLQQVALMTGKECESAERVRIFRENKRKELLCNEGVTKCNDNIEEEVDKEKKEEKKKEKKKEEKIYISFGEFGWIKLTNEQYEKLQLKYGKAEIDFQIEQLDLATQGTNNKNKYKDWNAVLHRAIAGNWYKQQTKQQGKYEYQQTKTKFIDDEVIGG